MYNLPADLEHEGIVSDFHKFAYGFRPTNTFWTEWRSADDVEKRVIWEQMWAKKEKLNAS